LPTSSRPGTPFDGAFAERSQPAELRGVDGDDQLARMVDRDAVCLREGLDLGLPLATQSSLERSRLVVQPGVEHAAVVTRLVGRELGLLLQDRDPERGPALLDA